MGTRACPHCGERIQNAAKFCRYCRQQVVPVAEMSPIVKIGGALVALAVAAAVVAGATSKPQHAPAMPAKLLSPPAPTTPPQPAPSDPKAEARKMLSVNLAGGGLKTFLKAAADEQKETPITYAHLKKNADRYSGRKTVFQGVIDEIGERNGETIARIAANGNSELMFWVQAAFETDFVEGNRVDVAGILAGATTYQSQAGWNITIPTVLARSIQKRGTFDRVLGIRHEEDE